MPKPVIAARVNENTRAIVVAAASTAGCTVSEFLAHAASYAAAEQLKTVFASGVAVIPLPRSIAVATTHPPQEGSTPAPAERSSGDDDDESQRA